MISSVNEAKRKIKELEERKAALQKEIDDIDKAIAGVKVELAEFVLGNDVSNQCQDENDDKIAIVQVAFKPNGKTYDYLWTHNTLPGEYVVVPSYNGEERVRVVGFLTDVTPNPHINYKKAHPAD